MNVRKRKPTRSALGCHLGDDIRLGNRSATTQLGVDLHAHIGNVLRRGRHDVLGLHDLRGNTEANVAGLLDATVNFNIAVVDDEEQKVRRRVVAEIR
jgi:hypothetical protein